MLSSGPGPSNNNTPTPPEILGLKGAGRRGRERRWAGLVVDPPSRNAAEGLGGEWVGGRRLGGGRGRPLGASMRSPIRKAEKNVLRKLAQRELSRKGNRTFDRSSAQEKFRGYELCVRRPYFFAPRCPLRAALHSSRARGGFLSFSRVCAVRACALPECSARHARPQSLAPAPLLPEKAFQDHRDCRRRGPPAPRTLPRLPCLP